MEGAFIVYGCFFVRSSEYSWFSGDRDDLGGYVGANVSSVREVVVMVGLLSVWVSRVEVYSGGGRSGHPATELVH